MARMIKLETWAKQEYGDDAPDVSTLRRWADKGHLFPPAEKHGKCWFVQPNTKYTSHNTGSIASRMRAVYGTKAA
jgi:predicted site-specific integrase-resolvase